ncbi:hypothetical protein [Paraburkholderia phosphatilytica]|uniref:hypothetical protein n=1 Tax=Paraburkholderia phosphatilytica TaxID=2282883 RepID=UPI000E50D389|nr:hypothetical protein [Paraburkholderia phosphatilytica]
MHDAEIAITLMNRWERRETVKAGQSAVELLREGDLGFRHITGQLVAGSTPREDGWTFECLEFDDGSRAFRLADNVESCARTPWAAIPPMLQTTTPE